MSNREIYKTCSKLRKMLAPLVKYVTFPTCPVTRLDASADNRIGDGVNDGTSTRRKQSTEADGREAYGGVETTTGHRARSYM